MPFRICKNFCKILNNLIFNQEKLKMCKFPLTGCLQKICNFFRKTCAIHFLMSKAFQKAKFYQNLTSGNGSKQRFSMLQEKAVIQAVCLRTQAVSIKARCQAYREGFGYVGNINVKKLRGGQIDPPPAGIGLILMFKDLQNMKLLLKIILISIFFRE